MPERDSYAFIDEELAAIRQAELFRSWRVVESACGNQLLVDGRAFDNFCSNNYLGLAADPEVVEAARAATAKYGAGAGSARLICGTQRPAAELEAALARFKETEAALVFSSGYLANLGLVTTLVGPEDAVIADRLVHASLIDACRLSRARFRVFRHNDMNALDDRLRREATRRRRLIVVDGVFSMDGDVAPLAELCALAERRGAMVLVDDAHGTGALGPGGRGVVKLHGVDPARVIQMGTLSKALGSFGGFIAGSRSLIELLINRARPFIFDTAPPAGPLAAARKALEIVEREPARVAALAENARRLREGATALGLNVCGSETQIVPILIGDAANTMRAAERLRARGIFVTGIRPPTVKPGACRLRLTAMSTHTPEMLKRVLAALAALRGDGLLKEAAE